MVTVVEAAAVVVAAWSTPRPKRPSWPALKLGPKAEKNVGVEFTQAEKTKLAGIATGATAVSIADVLATILEGTDISIDRTTSGQITISYSGGGAMGDHTRRIARSADEVLSVAEVTAGASFMTSTVTLAEWGQGVFSHIFLGVPEDEDDITDVQINGVSAFNGYEAFEDGSGDAIIVEGHKWWYTTDTQDGEFAYTAEIIQ